MKVLRIREPDAIRPLHVVMIVLVIVTLAGGCFLLSAARPTGPVDGAIEWQEQSPLRAVVELLCLNYRLPTFYAGAVKSLILGLGAGLAIIALGIAVVTRSRTSDEETEDDASVLAVDDTVESSSLSATPKAHIAPLVAAQVLVGLYLLWSFASSRWSLAPQIATGGSILLAIHLLWAFCLGNGLNPSAARLASRAVVVIITLTAVLAVWYHYGRNPTLRADFPVGNPIFLSACLIPGLLLAAALACEKAADAVRTRRITPILLVVLSVGAIAVGLWAFFLADSRASYVGLVFGVLAMGFFALRGRRKWIAVGLTVGVLALGAVYFSRSADAFSPTGRSATLRLRAYAWSYAWRMFNERPLQGHGQGGFVLTGDSYAANDVLQDPLVFESRIAHVHNEWLEVMADLGSVGLVLIVAALLLTLRAGAWALAVPRARGQRWALLALLGSLVGLTVEECFSVGLRVPGVGTLFYTVIGLIWALSAHRTSGLVRTLSRTSGRRIGAGTVAGLLGLVVLAVSQQDFAAGRDAYRAEEAMLKGGYERAVEWAGRAASRLNPQRALTNRYRLSEAHLRAADYLQDRALDRQQRAQQMDPPDLRLIALAEEDYRLSDEHCERGSAELKELILRAPGFINHGRLGYWLNLTRARNAAARGDVEKQQALLRDAATAVQREMLRQPFSPSLATDYVKVAGPTLDLAEILEVLARPLRHHRMTNPYLELLREMAADPEFDRYHEPLVPKPEEVKETWAPERLRLAAAIQFLRGDYDRAREELELAAEAYETLATTAPLGAASCYAELAICHFFARPGDARPALASAARAIALAPESRSGRELKSNVQQRMVEFHLAADQEEEAADLLNQTAPPGTTEEDLRQELAIRYRHMCESLLERREARGILRKPPAQLAPKLRRWVGRAIELGPGDAYTHYLAADLAFYVGDDKATAAHLQNALDRGLPTELVRQFLEVACEQRPDSEPLVSLRAILAPPAALPAPSPDTPQGDPAPY